MEKRVKLPTLLRPEELARVCRLGHLPPASDLASFLAVAWTMEWSLPDGKALAQPVLPNPCFHIMVDSAETPQVWGIVTDAFPVTLTGDEFVFGLKFRPCGFHAFWKRPVFGFTDRRVALTEVFPETDAAAIAEAASRRDWRGLMDCLEGNLRGLDPAMDPSAFEIEALIGHMSAESTIHTVDEAARWIGVSPRTLQRLFRTLVGVGPKWVIRRIRLKEAAARVESGKEQDWADLANRLGYFDQAHMIQDFKRMVGETPAAFARYVAPGCA